MLELIALLILIMNFIDGLSTLYLVNTQIATESNPLMAFLMNTHPLLFIAIKILLVTICTAVLIKYKDYKLSKIGLWIGFAVYLFIICWHLYGFIFLV